MADILAYAETRGGELRPVAGEVVATARKLADEMGGQVVAVVVGGPGSAEVASGLSRFGADRILVCEAESLSLYQPDATVELLASVTESVAPGAILFPASAQGKDLAARVAARLGVALGSEATEIVVEDGSPVISRPMYGGKAYGRFRFLESPALISIRPNVFPATADPRESVVEN
ncbi:MAG: electron transfer flavoprotein subunit alpha/FixB family protein, partial [marine benthic group bacterium]|nr:electron transfer flavoprotein subunit alpha/FixB family protein [Gemmatimonadota bacterium]